MNTQKQQYTNW